jgi:peptide/nickel transport system ATP-binding protein
MGSERETVVELDRVIKKYRTKGSFFSVHGEEVVALNQVSIKVFKGEIFGLVGESGSGKTTAGRLIVRLEEPEEGRILLDNRDITHLERKDRKSFSRKVQMIFQDPYQSLNPQLSIIDTVSEPLTIHGIGNARQKEDAVRQVMKAVGLSPPQDFVHRYPHQLSGGQRQRVAIARAMILEPEFVVADEPTSMLDASISAQIFKILLRMRDEFDVSIMFITHSLAAARYLCDRIGVIYKGSVMEVGPAEDVIHNPKHPYTRALLDALPKFGHTDEVPLYGTLRETERDFNEDVGCAFFPRCEVGLEGECSREAPQLDEVEDSHWVACFRLESGP